MKKMKKQDLIKNQLSGTILVLYSFLIFWGGYIYGIKNYLGRGVVLWIIIFVITLIDIYWREIK